MSYLLMLLNGFNFFAQQFTWEAVVNGRGLELTFVGMSVIFSGLLTLTLILTYLENIINLARKIMMFLSGKKKSTEVSATNLSADQKALTGEEAAAICSALALYHKMHMSDNREILTVKSELRMLSPWALSGKIHPTRKVM
jgi:Na+-transporting methylmalonyl-CoA/oxaloacetate decarboxylase gamma subunit